MASTLEDLLDAWQLGLAQGRQNSWNLRMRTAISELSASGSTDLDLDQDRSWALLGWCEGATSTAVQTDDLSLLEVCVIGLSLVPTRFIDRREVELVGSLVRRSVELLGIRWVEFRQRFAGSRSLLELLDGFPSEVSAASHREIGTGPTFRFEKVRLAQMSEEELLRRLDGG